MDEQDYLSLNAEGHGLKGVALSAGFPALASAAQALEHAARSKEKQNLESLLAEIEYEVQRARSILHVEPENASINHSYSESSSRRPV